MARKPKRRVPPKIEIADFRDPCACGSGLRAEMVYNENGQPCAYVCSDCRTRRLPTFGIDPKQPNRQKPAKPVEPIVAVVEPEVTPAQAEPEIPDELTDECEHDSLLAGEQFSLRNGGF